MGRQNRGATLIEYSILVALLSVTSLAAIYRLEEEAPNVFCKGAVGVRTGDAIAEVIYSRARECCAYDDGVDPQCIG